MGKATLSRVSDVLALKYSDVFDEQGHFKSHAYIHDQKMGKINNHIHSKRLLPSGENDKHIDGRQFYRIIQKVSGLLSINYLRAPYDA